MSHSPDEAQLTAYLLGELSPEKTVQVEAQLAVSAALRDELAGLRQTVASLEAALAAQTPPAVPALDRQKLHSLLQSAVVTSHEPTVSAPALLATAPVQPARGSTSRGWLVAASVLVLGGLVGLSQMEQPAGRSVVKQDQLLRESLALSSNSNDLRFGSSQPATVQNESRQLVEQEIAQFVEQYNDLKQQKRYDEALVVAEHALRVDPNSPVAVQMQQTAKFAKQLAQSAPNPAKDESYYWSFHDVEASAVSPLVAQDLDSVAAVTTSAPHSGPVNLQAGTTLVFDVYNVTQGNPGGVSQNGIIHSPEPGLTSDSFWLELGRGNPEPQVTFSLYDSNAIVPTNTGLQGLGLADPALAPTLGKPAIARFSGEPDDFRNLSYANFGFLPNVDSPLPELEQAEEARLSELAKAPSGQQQNGRFLVRGLSLATPRIRLENTEEDLLGLQEGQAQESKARAKAKDSGLSALTVSDYETGLAQLGTAVRGWQELGRASAEAARGSNKAEGLNRGLTTAEESKPTVSEFDRDVDELQELEKLVVDQTTELKKLRDAKPEVTQKPLAEVEPEAARQAQLALVRVSRELQRQQRVWYYREGYVRDLEATIAAAEQYAHVAENDFVTPEAQPLSTFGIDVDTASYSNVRRFVESGQLPPPDAVRIEELINSFQYDGPKVEGEHPLAIAAEVSPCPWQPQHQLLRVALKGKSIDLQQRPPARLVFLVDTSGSMSDANKLPLVKQSLRILVEQMREQDRLSIVTYSDNAGLLLDSTGGDKREAILATIDGLVSDGSTNGEAGLKLAYEVAVKQFGEGATNRVMLCTDGDFNVGESADSELVKLIEKQRQTGVFLNIFGFGSGNLKDAKLEAIADKGNGQYIYIDGVKEARKTLLNELTGTLYTIAKDVKIQLEFNPNLVGSYRLVGYENRAMAAKDFSNDKVDSGDMGAGHSVVALYEIVPPGAPQPVAPQPETEPLKYKRAGSVSAPSENAVAPASTLTPSPSPGGRGEAEGATEVFQPAPAAEAVKPADPLATELCTIRVRYKQPTSNESTKIETVVTPPEIEGRPVTPISRDHVWATAVAQFGLLTRHSTFVGTGNYSQVLELAQSAIGDDPTGQRREFVTLVRQTQSLSFERERQLAEISRRAEEHRRVVEEIKTVEKAPDVMTKASCSGKYRTLLRRIEVADDQPTYGEFKDWGHWVGAEYKAHKNLPGGYWVYVAPHWYIWGESTEQVAVDSAK